MTMDEGNTERFRPRLGSGCRRPFRVRRFEGSAPTGLPPWLRPSVFTSSPGRVFLVTFVLIFCMSAAWSAATPLDGGPDEPAQVIRAVSLWRGEIIGRA